MSILGIMMSSIGLARTFPLLIRSVVPTENVCKFISGKLLHFSKDLEHLKDKERNKEVLLD